VIPEATVKPERKGEGTSQGLRAGTKSTAEGEEKGLP